MRSRTPQCHRSRSVFHAWLSWNGSSPRASRPLPTCCFSTCGADPLLSECSSGRIQRLACALVIVLLPFSFQSNQANRHYTRNGAFAAVASPLTLQWRGCVKHGQRRCFSRDTLRCCHAMGGSLIALILGCSSMSCSRQGSVVSSRHPLGSGKYCARVALPPSIGLYLMLFVFAFVPRFR